jgi:uncharacterized protein
MSPRVLKALTHKFILHNKDVAVFCWHGGEPNLAGVDFFELAIEYQQQFGKKGVEIINCLQSNGTTITPELARFYAKHDFKVGISIDGPQAIHDKMRISKSKKSSYLAAVQGLELLKRFNVKYSVIATVSKETLPYAEKVFEHLVNLGFRNISYSPVFDSPIGEYPSITCNEWLTYISRIFYKWFELGNDKIQIREINEVVAWFSKATWPCCNSLGTCARWFVIDPFGNIFPCEKLGREVCFGNVLTDEFGEIMNSSKYRQFILGKDDIPSECQSCESVNFCNNGCRQMRVYNGQFNPRGRYAFCQQRKDLFRIIDTEFRKVL